MIFFQGLGLLVLVIGVGCMVATQHAVIRIFGDERYYADHSWPKALAAVTGGLTLWFLGRYLHSKGVRRLVDPATGESVVLRRRHTLFFLRMEYWGLGLVALGIAAVIWNV